MDRCERSSRYEKSNRSVNETSSRHHKESARKDLEDKVKTVKDKQTQFREEMLLVSGCDVMDDDPLRRARRMIDEGDGGLKILRWTAIGPLAEAVKAAGTMMLEGVSASNLETVVDCAARMSTGKVAQIYNCAKQAFRGYNMGLTLVGNDGGSSSRSPESAEKSTAKGGAKATTQGVISSSSCKESRVGKAADKVNDWLGQEPRMIKNKADDPIFISKDSSRRARFDFNNPHGDRPHMHLEQKNLNGRWKDAAGEHRIYPMEE